MTLIFEPLPFSTDLAVCKVENVPTETFFPEKGDEKGRTKLAKAYCNRCPVRKACAWYAAAGNEQGIWGATTDKQRRGIRKREGLARPASPRADSWPDCTASASCGRKGCQNVGCVDLWRAAKTAKNEYQRSVRAREKVS